MRPRDGNEPLAARKPDLERRLARKGVRDLRAGHRRRRAERDDTAGVASGEDDAERTAEDDQACRDEKGPNEGLLPRLTTRLTLPRFGSTVPGSGFCEITRPFLTFFE